VNLTKQPPTPEAQLSEKTSTLGWLHLGSHTNMLSDSFAPMPLPNLKFPVINNISSNSLGTAEERVVAGSLNSPRREKLLGNVGKRARDEEMSLLR
jgi:hypothetical protein